MQKKDTGKVKILLLVAETELVPHTDIAVAMEPFMSYFGVRKNVRELLEREYIKEAHVPCYEKRYLTVTNEGIKYIEGLFDIKLRGTEYKPEYKDSLPSKKKRRMARVGEVLGYLMGAGVHVLEREKPTLDNLLTSTNETYCREIHRRDAPPVKDPWAAQRPVVHSAADVAPLLHDGIFYSSAEVKKCLRAAQFCTFPKGSEDAIRNARFIGVVLMSHTLYVIYNTRDNLMYWEDRREKLAEETMRALFGKCSMYPTHDTFFDEGRLPAIVFGETMAALPALVTGHKGGVDKSVKHNNFEVKYKQLNSKIDAYWEMYFVPTEKIGLEILAHTITDSRVQRYNAIRDFIEQFRPQVYLCSDALQPYGHSSDHYEFAYLPIFDIKFIRWLRERVERVMVATYREATDSISKSLGTKIIGGLDFRAKEPGKYEKLNLRRYGNDGRLA